MLEVKQNSVEQADAVLDSLLSLRGEHIAEDVVLGLHPDNEVLPHLEECLRACGVTPRYAAGTSLPQTPPVRLLEAVAGYREDLSFEALASLMRHPDVEPLIRTGSENLTQLDAVDSADQ